MDGILLYLSKDTIDRRKYLKSFFKLVEVIKENTKKIDVYKYGLEDDYNFWIEMYDYSKLPEEKTKIKPNIGIEFQVKI